MISQIQLFKSMILSLFRDQYTNHIFGIYIFGH